MGRAFLRFRQITAVIVRHGLGHLLEQRRSRRKAASDRSDTPSVPDLALRFRRVLEELGPTFVKFGQVLASRGDLLPAGFAEALRGLQDDVTPMTTEQVHAQLQRAFGVPVPALFASFDEAPIASASIAQVHRAKTRDGQDVAVKIQRPGLREQIAADLDLLQILARLCQNMIQETGMVAARDVVDEFADMLHGELDFAREADMMLRFSRNADKPGRTYVVPTPISALTQGPVLTMQWLQGQRLADVTPGPFAQRVAGHIVQACFDQLFLDGLFHADPHPGNCLVLEDGRLGLIDFGATARLSYSMRETLVVIVLSVGMRDAGAIARLLYRVGIPEERVRLASLREAVAELLEEKLRDQQTYAEQDPMALLQALFDVASRFGVRIPAEYALIGRAAVTVEGILRQLDPDFEVVEQARPMLRKLLEEQFHPRELGNTALRNILRARDFARELPMAVTQVAMDLEHGKLRLQMENQALAQIPRAIDTLGLVVFMGLVAAALIVGSMLVLARTDARVFGLPVVPLVGLYGASMLFGTALGRWYLAPRWRKFSVLKWFRRSGRAGRDGSR